MSSIFTRGSLRVRGNPGYSGMGVQFSPFSNPFGFFFTENRSKRWKNWVKVMYNCEFIHPRWVSFMKKWAIHTLFMSIILGFCQKNSYSFITHLHRGFLGSCCFATSQTCPARRRRGLVLSWATSGRKIQRFNCNNHPKISKPHGFPETSARFPGIHDRGPKQNPLENLP
jgi:hypothetical protein